MRGFEREQESAPVCVRMCVYARRARVCIFMSVCVNVGFGACQRATVCTNKSACVSASVCAHIHVCLRVQRSIAYCHSKPLWLCGCGSGAVKTSAAPSVSQSIRGDWSSCCYVIGCCSSEPVPLLLF